MMPAFSRFRQEKDSNKTLKKLAFLILGGVFDEKKPQNVKKPPFTAKRRFFMNFITKSPE